MKTLPSRTYWGLLGLLWLFSAASLVHPPDSGPGPSISGRPLLHYSLRLQFYSCPALQPHQYPTTYFTTRVPKIKILQYSFSTLIFYVATLVLLRAWITYKYNLPQGKILLPKKHFPAHYFSLSYYLIIL